MRRMARAESQVHEEGFVSVDGAQIGDHSLRLVDQVLGEVVAVLPRARGVDLVVVAHQGGRELVRLTAEEPVPALEATP